MAKKRGPKPKTGVDRHPCGKIRADLGTAHLAAQRLASVDTVAARRAFGNLEQITRLECQIGGRAPTHQEAALLRECVDIVHTANAAANNPNLSFPLGIAYERGVICKAEFDAGLEYARLHRVLFVAKIGGPAAATSCFRSLLAHDAASPPDEDSEDYQKRLGRTAERFGKAVAVLQHVKRPGVAGLYDFGLGADFAALSAATPTDLGCLQAVEDLVIYGATPSWLIPRSAYTPSDQLDRSAFQAGLRALAEHFGYDKREHDAQPAAAPHSHPAPSEPSEEISTPALVELAKPAGPTRASRPRLDVVFGAADRRAEKDDVKQAVERLLRSGTRRRPPAA